MITSNVSIEVQSKAVKTETKEEKTIRAAQEWESFFIGYMLKEMRKTVPKSSESGENKFAMDTYYQMLDEQIAGSIAKNGGFGLAKEFVKNISKQENISINKQLLDKYYNKGLNIKVPMEDVMKEIN